MIYTDNNKPYDAQKLGWHFRSLNNSTVEEGLERKNERKKAGNYTEHTNNSEGREPVSNSGQNPLFPFRSPVLIYVHRLIKAGCCSSYTKPISPVGSQDRCLNMSEWLDMLIHLMYYI